MLRVSAIGHSPYLYPDQNGILRGPGIGAIRILAEKFGFDFEIEYKSDWLNYYIENGTIIYKGAIADVVYGHSQFAICCIYRDVFTVRFIDLINHFHSLMYYKMAKPSELPPYWNLVKPFRLYTWIFTISALFGAILVFLLLMHVLKVNADDKFRNAIMVFQIHFCQSETP